MFQLLKSRDFGELFNDTFLFFKLKGKNYFLNFLKVSALLLIITMVLVFIGTRFLSDSFQSVITNSGSENEYLNQFFENHLIAVILFSCFFFVMIIAISLIQISYPIFYLQLLEKRPDYKPNSKELGLLIRKNIGKVFLFGLLSFFIIGIPGFIALIISYFLILVLIGIPLLLILVPLLNSVIYLTLYHYLSAPHVSYFDALGHAIQIIKNNFWKILGSNLLLSIIIQIAVSVISMIPMMFIFIGGFTSTNLPEDDEIMGVQSIIIGMAILYGLIILISFILNNIVIVNFGLAYYSEKDRKEGHTIYTELEQIGTPNE